MDRAKHNVGQPGATLPLSLSSPFKTFLPAPPLPPQSLTFFHIFHFLFSPLLPVLHLPLLAFSHGESTEKESGLMSDAKLILSRDGEGQPKALEKNGLGEDPVGEPLPIHKL